MADTTISQLNTISTLSANNFIPISDGTTTTKLGTDSLFGFRNRIINGAFNIWQRGLEFSFSTTSYTADRWVVSNNNGTATVSRSIDVPSNKNSRYSISVTCNEWVNGMLQKIEDLEYYADGKTYTFSAWVKGPAGKTAAISVGWVAEGTLYTFTGNWQYITRVITFPSNFSSQSGSGSIGGAPGAMFVHFVRAIGGSTLASGDTVLITQCQVEEGSTATPFEFRPIGVELDLCQRYYQIVPFCGTAVTAGTLVMGANSTEIGINANFKTEMRVKPSIIGIRNIGDFTESNKIVRVGTGEATVQLASPYQNWFISNQGITNLYLSSTTPVLAGYVYAGNLLVNAEL